MKNRLIKIVIISALAFLSIGCGGGGSTPQSLANSILEGEDNSTSHTSTNTVVEGGADSTLSSSTNSVTGVTSSSLPLSNTNLGGTLVPSPIEKVAKNSSGSPVQYDFEGYSLQIISSKTLSESEEIAHESVVVYGTINGKSTDALLKVNENYRDSNLTLQVFKENRLLFQKDGIEFTNQVAVNFGEITVE